MNQALRFAPLLAILAALAAAFYFDVGRYFSLEMIQENRDRLTAFVDQRTALSALLFVIVYAVAVAVSIPGASFLTLLGGFLFGTWFGGSLVVLAATVGAMIIFTIAKTALGQSLQQRIGSSFARIQEGFQQDGASYMLVLRLVPIFPFWIVNIVPALLGVSTRVFALATLFGIMPASFVYASLGSGLGMILDKGEQPDLGLILEPRIILPLIGLALLAMVPVVYRRFRAKPAAQERP